MNRILILSLLASVLGGCGGQRQKVSSTLSSNASGMPVPNASSSGNNSSPSVESVTSMEPDISHLGGGMIIQTPPLFPHCQITVNSCLVPEASILGTHLPVQNAVPFIDDNGLGDPQSCFAKAKVYSDMCQAPMGATTTATFFQGNVSTQTEVFRALSFPLSGVWAVCTGCSVPKWSFGSDGHSTFKFGMGGINIPLQTGTFQASVVGETLIIRVTFGWVAQPTSPAAIQAYAQCGQAFSSTTVFTIAGATTLIGVKEAVVKPGCGYYPFQSYFGGTMPLYNGAPSPSFTGAKITKYQ